MKASRGYSMVEVVAVLILLFILVAAGIWSFGNSRSVELFGKISQDLARIDSAKSSWRTDHPEDAFPSDEPGRFATLQPYLKSGLMQVGALANWQPANVNYFINGELSLSMATNNMAGSTNFGKGYDRSVNDWYGN
jgi:type II secretory pathway pseudopilin PulG